MARGTVLTEEVRRLIAEVYLGHRDWRAKKIQKEVIDRLHRVNPYVDPNWPGHSVVQKELTKMRRRHEEKSPNPLDGPWSTASLAQYPIPPEALPSVLEVWVWTRVNNSATFTIRQAQWAARLYAITKNTKEIVALVMLARGHALTENICELIGKPYVNSSNIDLLMFSLMTGPEITPEEQQKILGISEEQWLAFKEAVKDAPGDVLRWDAIAIREALVKNRIKEAQNERSHSQEG